MNYIIFNDQGEILRTVSCPKDMAVDQLSEGEWLLEGRWDDTKFYVENGSVVERPHFPITIEGSTITGIPIPTTITIEGVSYEVTEGTLELEFDAPGSYTVSLRSFPYLDTEVTIEA